MQGLDMLGKVPGFDQAGVHNALGEQELNHPFQVRGVGRQRRRRQTGLDPKVGQKVTNRLGEAVRGLHGV